MVVLSCQAPKPADNPAGQSANLTDKDWTLIELGGQTAGSGAGGKPATLHLNGMDGLATGFAGCNRFMGTFTLSGEQLRFSPIAMTRMACNEGMELEQRLAAALTATRHYTSPGTELDLMGDSGTVARLESR